MPSSVHPRHAGDTADCGRKRIAIVLAGGAARGAYEVGVIQHILEDVSQSLGYDIPLDILSGTSVGAFNACGLAAFADEPRGRASRLVQVWRSLRVDQLIQPDFAGLLRATTDAIRLTKRSESRPRAFLNPSGLERLLSKTIPFPRIDDNLRRGLISALTVSATHVATGRTFIFVHRADRTLPPWSRDPTISPRATAIGLEHAMASAAIPMLFPSVEIQSDFYCDGGLRQNVPLSPARRLGADGVIVINPKFIAPRPSREDGSSIFPTLSTAPGPLLLLGKTLNALLLDRIDNDLARLRGINRILEAGERRYGPNFVTELNTELGHKPGRGVRPMRSLLIRTSRDIGKLSAEFVRSAEGRRRIQGPLARVMHRLADGEARSGDLLSYLLFDGTFAAQLIELGREDARDRHSELCSFFTDLVQQP